MFIDIWHRVDDLSLGDRATLGVLAVGTIAFARITTRPCVVVRGDAVIVRNFFWTHRLLLRDVRDILILEGEPWARLDAGRRWPIAAVALRFQFGILAWRVPKKTASSVRLLSAHIADAQANMSRAGGES
jgi:hypothetical protein